MRKPRKNRTDLIFNPRKTNRKDDKIRLIITHNAGNPPLHQWMREAKKQLVRNERAKKMGDCIQISSRQPKNLKKIVAGTNRTVGGQ